MWTRQLSPWEESVPRMAAGQMREWSFRAPNTVAHQLQGAVGFAADATMSRREMQLERANGASSVGAQYGGEYGGDSVGNKAHRKGQLSIAWLIKNEDKSAIWRREFIDIFSLLKCDGRGCDVTREDDQADSGDDSTEASVEPNFTNWLRAFNILATIVLEKSPEEGAALIAYQNRILEIYRHVGGEAWLNYDRAFRKRMQWDPELGWDEREDDLYLVHVSTYRQQASPADYGRDQSNNTSTYRASKRQRSWQPGPGSDTRSNPPKQSKSPYACRHFARGFCKLGSECRFKH